MGYERYPRGTQPGDYFNRTDEDYGRDYGSGRDYSYSSARDYEAAGEIGRDANRDRSGGRDFGRDARWGSQEYGNAGYSSESRGRGGYGGGDRSYGSQSGSSYGAGRGGYGNDDRYGQQQYGQSYAQGYTGQGYGAGGYGGQGYGRGSDEDRGGWNRGRGGQQGYGPNRGDYGRQPQGYDYDDRGFFARAGDEVRSWFGDDEAERRRDMDARYDQRAGGDRDSDYHSWRSGQVAQLDRDYDEYRRENRSKFENEFTSWRTGRQGQRDLLTKVDEHMDVVGSDGTHVGTVDKVRGDRILLTKNDADAGGRHHSIPSSWLKTVDTKVTLSKTADEAKKHWRDEERNQAMFGDDSDGASSGGRDAQGRMLNRSFSGTY